MAFWRPSAVARGPSPCWTASAVPASAAWPRASSARSQSQPAVPTRPSATTTPAILSAEAPAAGLEELDQVAHRRRSSRGVGGIGPLDPDLALDRGAVGSREAAGLECAGQHAGRQDLHAGRGREVAAHGAAHHDRARIDIGVHIGPFAHQHPARHVDVTLEASRDVEVALARHLALEDQPGAETGGLGAGLAVGGEVRGQRVRVAAAQAQIPESAAQRAHALRLYALGVGRRAPARARLPRDGDRPRSLRGGGRSR